jgi:hypothetical protein
MSEMQAGMSTACRGRITATLYRYTQDELVKRRKEK